MGRNARRKSTAIDTTTSTTPEVAIDATPTATVETPTDAPVDAPTPEPEVPSVPAPPATVDEYKAALATAVDRDGAPLSDEVRATLALPSFVAMAAGLMAVRATVADPAAIRAAVPAFTTAASAVHAPSTGGTVNVGRFMGKKIMDGQNFIYAVARLVRVPDAAIAVAWCAEWPGAKCDFAVKHGYIASTRGDVNSGRHGWSNGHAGTTDTVKVWGGRFVRYSVEGVAL